MDIQNQWNYIHRLHNDIMELLIKSTAKNTETLKKYKGIIKMLEEQITKHEAASADVLVPQIKLQFLLEVKKTGPHSMTYLQKSFGRMKSYQRLRSYNTPRHSYEEKPAIL